MLPFGIVEAVVAATSLGDASVYKLLPAILTVQLDQRWVWLMALGIEGTTTGDLGENMPRILLTLVNRRVKIRGKSARALFLFDGFPG